MEARDARAFSTTDLLCGVELHRSPQGARFRLLGSPCVGAMCRGVAGVQVGRAAACQFLGVTACRPPATRGGAPADKNLGVATGPGG